MFYHFQNGAIVKSPQPKERPVSETQVREHKRDRTPKGTGAYTTLKLTLAQQIKLVKWLEDHRNELQAERPRRTTAAEQASRDLGFPIGEGSIKSCSKACGCQWNERQDRKTGTKDRYKTNSRQIACLKQQVQTLREALIAFMAEAGTTVPASLQAGWPNAQPTE